MTCVPHRQSLFLLCAFAAQMSCVGVLVFDEVHHAVRNHPYNTILEEFVNNLPGEQRPHLLGLTASPRKADDLERSLGARLVTALDR